MGLGLVPCGIQRLSLAPSQSCSIPSFNRPRCPALPHQTPCPAQQIQHPWCGQLFPTQRPPKIQFAFPCHQPAIFTAGEEAAVEEGGSMARQSRAEPQGCSINMQSHVPVRRWPDSVWLIQTNCCEERWKFSPRNNGGERTPSP